MYEGRRRRVEWFTLRGHRKNRVTLLARLGNVLFRLIRKVQH